jgi:hypothetical protein
VGNESREANASGPRLLNTGLPSHKAFGSRALTALSGTGWRFVPWPEWYLCITLLARQAGHGVICVIKTAYVYILLMKVVRA